MYEGGRELAGVLKSSFELALRMAERFERLTEIEIYKIAEQSVLDPYCPDQQFAGKETKLDRFILQKDLRQNLDRDVLAAFCVHYPNVISFVNQLVDLFQAEMPAPGGIIITPIRVFPDFQGRLALFIVSAHSSFESEKVSRFSALVKKIVTQ